MEVEGEELKERWSIRRKTELVLWLLSGEKLDAVSRESQGPGQELQDWRGAFREKGGRGLRTRAEPQERELTLARAEIGELMMRLERAEHLIEKRGFADEREEAEAMRRGRSTVTGRRYPLTMIGATFRETRASVYGAVSGG